MQIEISRVNIRPFTWEDIDYVYAIEISSFQFPWTKEKFGEAYLIHPNYFYVAEYNDRAVGYIVTRMEVESKFFFRSTLKAHILDLAIEPELKRKGIGKMLLKRILSQMKREGAKGIYLEVRQSNNEAINFYLKHGFEYKKDLKNYYFNEDGVLMQLEF